MRSTSTRPSFRGACRPIIALDVVSFLYAPPVRCPEPIARVGCSRRSHPERPVHCPATVRSWTASASRESVTTQASCHRKAAGAPTGYDRSSTRHVAPQEGVSPLRCVLQAKDGRREKGTNGGRARDVSRHTVTRAVTPHPQRRTGACATYCCHLTSKLYT